MKTITNIIEFGASFLEIIVLFSIVELICQKRLDEKLQFILKVTFSIIITYVVLYLNKIFFLYSTISCVVILTTIFSVIIYKDNIIKYICISWTYCFLITLLDFFIFLILGLLNNDIDYALNIITVGENSRILFILTAKLILLLFYILFKKICIGKYPIDNKYYKFIVFFTVLLFLLQKYCFFAILENSISMLKIGVGISWIMTFVVIVLIFVLFYIFSHNSKKQEYYNILNLKNSMLEHSYKNINDAYLANSRMFHDFNNNLNVIYNLLNENNIDKAITYIKDIHNEIKTPLNIVKTKMSTVDAVLNNKMQEAYDNNITVCVDIQFPDVINIKDTDICCILYNLIDNAIEACCEIEDIEKRNITIKIKEVNNFLFFQIINSVKENPLKDNDKLQTTKENKNIHGFGLKSVMSISDKYNGSIIYKYDNMLFFVTLYLCF